MTQPSAIPTQTAVAVSQGEIVVGQWQQQRTETPVLAIHGITANHLSWAPVAELTSRPVLAPDLRGRGRSAGLPGPYGMAAHAADCVAVLDAAQIDQAVVVGHSMGGFVASVLAHRYPDRVAKLILVDGGAPLPLPSGSLEAVLGPAMQRLSQTFATAADYLNFWRQHPAFSELSPALAAYATYDLTGIEPNLRSSVSAAAVRADFIDLHQGQDPAAAYAALPATTRFLRAERGMFDEPGGLYPDPTAIRLNVTTIADTNHYTILFGPVGAAAVAAALSEER